MGLNSVKREIYFQQSGNTPEFKDWLKSSHRGHAREKAHFFKIIENHQAFPKLEILRFTTVMKFQIY